MKQTVIQVDAFTDEPFCGNAAAVCVLEAAADDTWMQNVAAEMNLSETAFLYPIDDGYHLRWFTPTTEVDLCGHATLASAHVLWSEGHMRPDQIARFETRSGLLTATKHDDMIELDFPAIESTEIAAPPDLKKALGVIPTFVGHGKRHMLVVVATEEEVRTVKPDFSAMTRYGFNSAIVTAQAVEKDYEIVSRFFAPGFGIDEDPVTGFAHCCIAPYWTNRLNISKFTAFQASSRGGTVYVRTNKDRVFLGGQAVTVMRGELV